VVTFNANSGSVTPANATVGADGQLANLPTPAREGFAFNGWFTEATNGEIISANHVYSANTTIFAQWSQIRTVTFNPHGGEVNPTSEQTGTFGRLTLTELPTPTRAGFTFDGWFTSATGSTVVTLDRVYTANTTIHAQWTAIPVCSGDYKTCPIEGCVLCLPLPCADCGKYPCECPDFCLDCGQYPCECPELCPDCDRYPCICTVVCPDCGEEVCICQSGFYISEVNVSENWLEISNNTDTAVSAKGLYLSLYRGFCEGADCAACDESEKFCYWQMPAVIIAPGMTVRVRGKSNTATNVLKGMTANFDFDDDVYLQ
jgi:uncharacterized repeat protein (TIGR02543 family)